MEFAALKTLSLVVGVEKVFGLVVIVSVPLSSIFARVPLLGGFDCFVDIPCSALARLLAVLAAEMIFDTKELEICDRVVAAVVVDVVDVHAVGDWAVVPLPHGPVKTPALPLKVPAAKIETLSVKLLNSF